MPPAVAMAGARLWGCGAAPEGTGGSGASQARLGACRTLWTFVAMMAAVGVMPVLGDWQTHRPQSMRWPLQCLQGMTSWMRSGSKTNQQEN